MTSHKALPERNTEKGDEVRKDLQIRAPYGGQDPVGTGRGKSGKKNPIRGTTLEDQ